METAELVYQLAFAVCVLAVAAMLLAWRDMTKARQLRRDATAVLQRAEALRADAMTLARDAQMRIASAERAITMLNLGASVEAANAVLANGIPEARTQ